MERADAARNRTRVLDAAARLFAEKGAESTTMDDIAKAAGVGRATLYRRYPDRASIAMALLDEHERALQERMIRGEPPLGPGAPAAERLEAFGSGYIDLLERHAPLLVAAGAIETDGRGPYLLYATHLSILLAEAAPQLDAPLTARALLATLSPGPYLHARTALGWDAERMKRGWAAMAAALCS